MNRLPPWSVDSLGAVDFRALVGSGILVALGWAFVAVHIATALQRPDTGGMVRTLLGTAIPLGLAVTLFVGAAGVYYYDLGGQALRISGWTLFGTVAFSGVVGVALVSVDTTVVDPPTLPVVLINVAASGAVTGLLIGLYDARQHRLHRQFVTEHARAVELDQRLSVLRRVHRHDFRNKLNVIVGTAARLRAAADEAETRNLARTLDDAASDLSRIGEHLHELDRIRTGHAAHPEPVDLAAAVEEAVTAVESSVSGGRVERSMPDGLRVRASPLLSRAVEELLDNALRHAGDDPRVVVVASVVDGDHVELTVIDDGPGIPESEVVVHEAATETSLQHSDGLGLWLVNWIAEASDGEFHLERRTDGGTAATLELAVAHPP